MYHIDDPQDAKRIQRVLLERMRIDASLAECEALWNDHSDCFAASWLLLPDSDDDLQKILEELTGDLDLDTSERYEEAFRAVRRNAN